MYRHDSISVMTTEQPGSKEMHRASQSMHMFLFLFFVLKSALKLAPTM